MQVIIRMGFVMNLKLFLETQHPMSSNISSAAGSFTQPPCIYKLNRGLKGIIWLTALNRRLPWFTLSRYPGDSFLMALIKLKMT